MSKDLPADEREPLPQDGRADLAAGETHPPEAVRSLKQAMRRARFDGAERVGVLTDLRMTQIGRLELLQEALQPLLVQIPKDVEFLDVGIMPGATPRLFIDMIGFVEMGRDARVYRLLQDTRHSRVTIAESADIDRMVEAITNYVAHRLLERDRALAAEARDAAATRGPSPMVDGPAPTATTKSPAAAPTSGWRRLPHTAGIVFAFVIDLLGAMTFFTIAAFGVWLLWNRLRGQM